MSAPFSVRSTPRFDRLLKKLARQHPDLAEHFATALDVLRTDPYNHSRHHPIRKPGDKAGAFSYR